MDHKFSHLSCTTATGDYVAVLRLFPGSSLSTLPIGVVTCEPPALMTKPRFIPEPARNVATRREVRWPQLQMSRALALKTAVSADVWAQDQRCCTLKYRGSGRGWWLFLLLTAFEYGYFTFARDKVYSANSMWRLQPTAALKPWRKV